MSVLNLFDLSRNFCRPKESWLLEKYIEQQQPLQDPCALTSSTVASGYRTDVQLPLESKCSQSVTDKPQKDTSRQDQPVQTKV